MRSGEVGGPNDTINPNVEATADGSTGKDVAVNAKTSPSEPRRKLPKRNPWVKLRAVTGLITKASDNTAVSFTFTLFWGQLLVRLIN